MESIQQSQRTNERTVGKDLGKIKPLSRVQRRPKDKIKLFLHPSSIPTKFQTIHYDDNEDKGFNSTANRFASLPNELPGPGYYSKNAVDFHEMSLSKKGYGVGFASNNRRFKYHDPEQKARPSPAQYNVKDPIYFKSLASSTSPAFRLPLAGAPIQMGPHVTRSRWGLKPTPGPGSYDPIPKNYSRARLGVEENGASFVFKSQSKRGIQNPAIFVPPPGTYDTNDVSSKRVSGAQAAFKATWRDQTKSIVDTPGPGAYEVKINLADIIKLRNFKPDHYVNSPASESPKTSEAQKYIVPGPGNYEVASAAERVQKKAPVAQSAFKSTMPRFIRTGTRIVPGPGDYQPNLQSLWI